MKYIKKVILDNFQSHKHSVVEFDSQLNIIVGPSDSGKTAILRGIKWALFNEPSGDYFIREGESECSVIIIFNDGTKIKRYRSKSKNIYYLYDGSNNEMKFEGFGSSVPQEIIEATGIKKILLDSDISKSINLSDQLEGAFLLSERASTRANSIGRLVGVNIIDDALRECLRDNRNLSNTKKNIDDKILELENELLEYEYLNELSKKINYIETLRNEIYEKKRLLSIYKELMANLSSVSQEKKALNYSLKKLDGINSLKPILDNIINNINMYYYLNKQNVMLNKLSLNKNNNSKIITSLKHINKAEDNLVKLDYLYKTIRKLKDYKIKYEKLESELQELHIISIKLNSLDLIIDNSNKIFEYLQRLKKLITIRDRDLTIRKKLAIGIEYVEKLKTIDNIYKINDNLQEKNILMIKLKNLSNAFNSNSAEISKTKSISQKYKNEIDKQVIEYEKLLQKLEICPVCFSIIDNDKIKHIIKHYN